ncbi:MAG: helix-turn-helix domain-containing protein [Vicinamibacterales bacterium]
MRVDVLALDGVFDLGLSAMADVLQTANELAPMTGLDRPPFEVRLIGVRRRVATAHRLRVPVVAAGGRRPDVVMVPAMGYKMPGALEAALARADVQDGAALLGELGRRGSRVYAACIGTFVMAESGLLDGQRATTTWWLAPLFRRRYPAVQVEEARMIVPSGRHVTAGAALSHVDLTLWLVRTVSPELAALTARYLIVDSRPAQSAYALSDHLQHSDPVVQRFERWARARLAERFSLGDAAAAIGASKRTLARRLERVLGTSPLAYVQNLRVERAVHLLHTTPASVDAVAAEVGYADGVTLRRLLRRRHLGIRTIRQAAGSPG